MTPDEWRTLERLNGTSLTEEAWLACPAADSLLYRVLKLGTTDRQLRLFGCACCRLVWHHLIRPESKAAVEAAEQCALGELSAEAMSGAAETAAAVIPTTAPPHGSDQGSREEFVEYLAAVSAEEVARAEDEGGWPYWERLVDILSRVQQAAQYQRFGLDRAAMEAALCDRLRDIIGNPYRAVSIAPEWRTARVLTLAKGILDDRAFERLPVMADALEEAGCTEAEVLAHCREQRVHVPGCWAVVLLLAKQ